MLFLYKKTSDYSPSCLFVTNAVITEQPLSTDAAICPRRLPDRRGSQRTVQIRLPCGEIQMMPDIQFKRRVYLMHQQWQIEHILAAVI